MQYFSLDSTRKYRCWACDIFSFSLLVSQNGERVQSAWCFTWLKEWSNNMNHILRIPRSLHHRKAWLSHSCLCVSLWFWFNSSLLKVNWAIAISSENIRSMLAKYFHKHFFGLAANAISFLNIIRIWWHCYHTEKQLLLALPLLWRAVSSIHANKTTDIIFCLRFWNIFHLQFHSINIFLSSFDIHTTH